MIRGDRKLVARRSTRRPKDCWTRTATSQVEIRNAPSAATAEFDRDEFDLTVDGPGGRLVHKASGSRFAFHPDRTWRFLGHCFVADGPKLEFDRSWLALMQLLAVWLSELKQHLVAAPST
jgi:hypothetical protein